VLLAPACAQRIGLENNVKPQICVLKSRVKMVGLAMQECVCAKVGGQEHIARLQTSALELFVRILGLAAP